jgi:hypothetical protein
MKHPDASANVTNRRIRSGVVPRQDPFAKAISIGLLAAVVLVCAVLVAVPVLTMILR